VQTDRWRAKVLTQVGDEKGIIDISRNLNCATYNIYIITIPLTKTNSTTDKANDREFHAGP